MKRIIYLILLLITVTNTSAEAQFWKKKNSSSKKKPMVSKKLESTNEVAKKKTREIKYPSTITKDRYRIDVLLPLYLDEVAKDEKVENTDKLPERVQNSLRFYEGIKLAADTLTKAGYEVDVVIHDITQAALAPEKLIKSAALDSADLIIGAVQSYQLSALANYAQKKKINFVSVLSPADAGIVNNPYFTITQPTLLTHIKKIRAQALKKYPDQQIHLFYRTKPSVDSAAYQYMFTDVEDLVLPLVINSLPSTKQLELLFDSTQTNVILLPILDQGYVQQVMDYIQESFPSYRFDIYGLPSWKGMPKMLKTGKYPNIIINYSTPFYYNVNSSMTQYLSKAYKNEFKGKLTEMTVRGFETLTLYAGYLTEYGTIFNDKMTDSPMTISRYKLSPQWTEVNDLLYFENTHCAIYRFSDGSYSVTD